MLPQNRSDCKWVFRMPGTRSARGIPVAGPGGGLSPQGPTRSTQNAQRAPQSGGPGSQWRRECPCRTMSTYGVGEVVGSLAAGAVSLVSGRVVCQPPPSDLYTRIRLCATASSLRTT